MVKLDSVLRHSISPPSFDRTKLSRHRLVDAIHANIPRKLIVIAAPAGYGKTTLLSDFSAHTEMPVCWVRLTEADSDAMRLATVLAASLEKRFRRLAGKFDLTRLAGSLPEAIARAMAEVIDIHVSNTFVIALDDVHLINHSSAATSFLDAFLEVQPENVTLIASGREVIEVSLARLMAEGDLAGFGPQDLALTKQELIDLAQVQAGIELDEQEADRLINETRGWITGVLLSGKLSSAGLSALIQDPRPMVYEYMASVVLNRQPDDLRRFMINSSVFPVMTAEGCDFLLQQDSSHQFLHRIVRGGMFVTSTDEIPRTYEYHPQFRRFLLELLESADRKLLIFLRNTDRWSMPSICILTPVRTRKRQSWPKSMPKRYTGMDD
jgi:LuxR family maltose regulon positive regulatory protein